MASPRFSTNGNAVGAPASVSAGAQVVATLDSIDGVGKVEWSIAATDDKHSPSDYGNPVVTGSVGQTATWVALGAGTSAAIRCRINGGRGADGSPDATMIAVQKFFVPTAEGLAILNGGELDSSNTESSSSHGAVAPINDAIRRTSSQLPNYLFETPDDQLGATFVFDAKQCAVSGTAIKKAFDAGRTGSVLLNAATNYFNSDNAGPYGAKTPSLRTNNISGRLYSASGGPTGAGQWHMLFIVRADTAAANGAGYESFVGLGAPAAAHNLTLGVGSFLSYSDDNGAFGPTAIQAPAGIGGNALNCSLGKDYIIELQYDGATLSVWVDGKRNTAQDFAVALNISDQSYGFQSWYTPPATAPINNVRIDAGFFRTGAPIPRATVGKWLRYVIRKLGGSAKIFVGFGDSWTSGGAAGTTAANYFLACVRDIANATATSRVFVQNCGHSGAIADTILTSHLLTHVDPITHAHVWWGINDILANTAAVDIYASTIAAVGNLHSRGVKVIVGTIFQPNGLSGPQESIRQAYNTLVRANSAGADAIADYDAAMGPYNTNNFADHPTDLHASDTANRTILAPVGYAALQTL